MGSTFSVCLFTLLMFMFLSNSVQCWWTAPRITFYQKMLLFISCLFHHYILYAASYQNSQGSQNESDPNNTTVGTLFISCMEITFLTTYLWFDEFQLQIFVGNLDPNVTDDHLRQVFSQYGQLAHVKIPSGKRCGFVQFVDRWVN